MILFIILLPIMTFSSFLSGMHQNEDYEKEFNHEEINFFVEATNAKCAANGELSPFKSPFEIDIKPTCIYYSDETIKRMNREKRWKAIKKFFCGCCLSN
jgi:hypothetical protein